MPEAVEKEVRKIVMSMLGYFSLWLVCLWVWAIANMLIDLPDIGVYIGG